MKTIWGISLIIAFAVVLFGGISLVNTQILINNPGIDEQSLDLMSKYDNSVQNITTLQASRVDTSLTTNNTNQVEAFFREAAENKNNIEKFRDGVEYIWDLPEILLLSIPVLDLNDIGFISLFKGIVWFLIGALIILVLYKALRTGEVDN